MESIYTNFYVVTIEYPVTLRDGVIGHTEEIKVVGQDIHEALKAAEEYTTLVGAFSSIKKAEYGGTIFLGQKAEEKGQEDLVPENGILSNGFMGSPSQRELENDWQEGSVPAGASIKDGFCGKWNYDHSCMHSPGQEERLAKTLKRFQDDQQSKETL